MKKIVAQRSSKKSKTSFKGSGKCAVNPRKPVSKIFVQENKNQQVEITRQHSYEQPDTTIIVISFDFNSYELSNKDLAKLTELNAKIAKLNFSSIIIEGHTDSVGTEAYNLRLSEKRGLLVKDYLVSQGLSAEKLITIGHGSQFPYISNKTLEGRQMNRRVEFKIIRN